MLAYILTPAPRPFTKDTKTSIPITFHRERDFAATAKTLPPSLQRHATDHNFTGKPNTILFDRDDKGALNSIHAGIAPAPRLYDFAALADHIAKQLSPALLTKTIFTLANSTLTNDELALACLGWALACHKFDIYKRDKTATIPRLAWPKSVDQNRILAQLDAVTLARSLVNMPPNDLGPAELEQATRYVATLGAAQITTVTGPKLQKEFPLIHAVGVSSPRAPRLIDIKWGKPTHPKLTLVGKGVCFDTGGLDLKPGAFMLQMKKDMGGAAHVLGLALAIMALNLPVRLRVLIPAVENSVSGTAFRPRDVYPSRKGITVETSDTDAEGRLVLADALTLACEEHPDLIIDCATLTGSARAALGWDIPAVFSNDEALAHALKDAASQADDPLWPLPLWQGYKKELSSDIADLNNIGHSPAGAITAALFLEHFVEPSVPWLHIDMFAWEQSGKPGRPRGGADTGLRAMLAFVEARYHSSPSPLRGEGRGKGK